MKFLYETFLKDFKIAISYKAQFVFSIISIFITILTFFLISKLIDSGNSIYLKEYSSYMFFLIFGVISAEISMILITNPSKNVREMQLTGVFEELIASGKNISSIILSTFIYPIAWLSIRVMVYIIAAIFIFNINIELKNLSYITTFSTLFFVISMIGIGLISISSIITIKSGNFIGTMYLSISALLSGIAYPISVLPEKIRFISELLPTTHFLNIFRLDAMNADLAFSEISKDLSVLLLLSLVFFSFGLYLLKISIKIAKRHGSLLFY
jgi:ABC-2 type transport system permease protein